jgi:hypothetical protein
MQKLQKTYEAISSLLLNIAHLYINVEPGERIRYYNELCDGYPTKNSSLLASDKKPSFLATVLKPWSPSNVPFHAYNNPSTGDKAAGK